MMHFNSKSFDEALAKGGLMMVDFWASWCGPCKMLAPVVDQLAQQYEGKAVVGKVNVDEEQELAIRYGVMSIPTVIFFKDLCRKIPGSLYCATLEEVADKLAELARPGDLILTVGAGDIYRAGEALVK